MVFSLTDALTETHTFELYDHDAPDPNTLMATLDFVPWNVANTEFPATILYGNGADLTIEMEVSYVFD